MVTAEFAVALPAVVLVLALCLAGLSAVTDQIRCIDAARLAVRSAARGDDPSRARTLAVEAAPAGAHVSVDSGGGQARVVVTASAGGWGGFTPSWTLTASATSPVEAPSGGAP